MTANFVGRHMRYEQIRWNAIVQKQKLAGAVPRGQIISKRVYRKQLPRNMYCVVDRGRRVAEKATDEYLFHIRLGEYSARFP